MATFHRCDRCGSEADVREAKYRTHIDVMVGGFPPLEEPVGGEVARREISIGVEFTDRHAEDQPDLCLECRVRILQAALDQLALKLLNASEQKARDGFRQLAGETERDLTAAVDALVADPRD